MHATVAPPKPWCATPPPSCESESSGDESADDESPIDSTLPDHDDAASEYFDAMMTLPSTVHKAFKEGRSYQPTSFELCVAKHIKNLNGIMKSDYRLFPNPH